MNLKTEDNYENMYTSSNVDENANVQNEFGMYDDLKYNDPMEQFQDTPYVSPVEEPEKKSLKDIFLIALGIVVLVGISLWCLISGVKTLFLAPVHPMEEAFTNLVVGDVYEGTITCISPEVGELKHTINFIPAGTEHFYLMVSEDGTTVIPIRASSDWDTLYTSENWFDVSLQERGIVREMDYKVKSELMSELSTAFAAAGIQIESQYYLDLNANKIGGLQLFVGIVLIICILYFAVLVKRLEETNSTLKSVIGGVVSVLGFIALIMLIYLLNMT